MTSSVDFAHTATAQANRRAKADKLAAAAAWLGIIDPLDFGTAEVPEDDVRAAVLREAKVARASEETWALVVALLEQRPARRLPPGAAPASCGCQRHPVTGVLFESFVYGPPERGTGTRRPTSGWLCQHPEGYVPREPEPFPELEGFDDGSEPAWDDLVQTAIEQAGLVERRARPRQQYGGR